MASSTAKAPKAAAAPQAPASAKDTAKAPKAAAAPESPASAKEAASAKAKSDAMSAPPVNEWEALTNHFSKVNRVKAADVLKSKVFQGGLTGKFLSKHDDCWKHRLFTQGDAATKSDIKRLAKGRNHDLKWDAMALETGRRANVKEGGMVRAFGRVEQLWDTENPYLFVGVRQVRPSEFSQRAGLPGYPAPDTAKHHGDVVGVRRTDPWDVAKPYYPLGVQPAAGQRIRQLPYPVSVAHCLARGKQLGQQGHPVQEMKEAVPDKVPSSVSKSRSTTAIQSSKSASAACLASTTGASQKGGA